MSFTMMYVRYMQIANDCELRMGANCEWDIDMSPLRSGEDDNKKGMRLLLKAHPSNYG